MQKRSLTPINPTISSGSSETLLAANQSRTYLLIRNSTAANILIGLNGQALAGIVPTLANPGLVLKADEWYESTDETCPTGIITVYQTSGSNTNLISVMEA